MKIYDYNGKKNICGWRVKEARSKAKLTQAELAAKLQVAGIVLERDSISRIEIGTRFVADYELRAISMVLEVPMDWLVGGEDVPKL
ncbi:MAG: helix-turn-helix transcriptional regulator [Eubacteriales bacterium]